MGLISFPSLGWFQDRMVLIELPINSFFDQPSIQRFYEFCKINVSSSNDSLNCSMCMILTKAFDIFAFFFILSLKALSGVLGRYE
jgi:hypothetical protein